MDDSGGIVTFKLVVPGMKVTDGSAIKGTFVYVALDTNKDGKHDYTWGVDSDAEGFSWWITGPNGKDLPQSSSMS